MLDSVKLAVRVKNTAYDLELTDLIEACKADLKRVGIKDEKINSDDALIKRLILIYCKMNFGFDNSDFKQLQSSYNDLRDSLSLNKDYINNV